MRFSLRALAASIMTLAGGASAPALVGPAMRSDAFAPHVVMVLNRRAGAAGFCSAVVVARDAVLTAAHCVGLAEDLRAHFREPDGAATLIDVASVAIHPLYRADAVARRARSVDLALVRLARPLPDRFQPAALARAQTVALGAPLRIAGFGVAVPGRGETAGVLREGGLVAQAPLSSVLLWAGDPRGGGLGACEGDSGAPIFAGDGQVVAIVDWAEGRRGAPCGKLTQGALVGPQRGWIDATLAAWGDAPAR